MTYTVLVVDDEPRYRELYTQVLDLEGVRTAQAGTAEEALGIISKTRVDLVVSDLRMPGASGLELLEALRERGVDVPFLLVTAHVDVRDAVAALKLGAVDYLAKPVNLDELVACVQDALGMATDQHPDDPPPEALGDIIATSPASKALLREAWHVARSEIGLLLTGESGTGKEVMAQFIHRSSARASRPFVAVNCAALPASLLASELFGHERGAFTGANAARRGRFREANGGTLFLDEIGDMPLTLQPVLLRAIEARTVNPLGATGEVSVDFRLIAATNRDLEEDVAAGLFRADLFYRLNVIALHLPPLREREEDILPLARSFIADKGTSKRLARATTRLLKAHGWPGNVRELKNAMHRARLLARGDVILPEHLPPGLREATNDAPDAQDKEESIKTLRESEIVSLRKALEATGGNRTRAAELLGITRRGLLKKLKRFGIERG